MAETAILERSAVVRHGRKLEYFTIAWNTLEGLVAVIAGAMAGSISLLGFGIDSFIEVTSGSVLLWRMSVDSDVHRRETNEKRALRFVGACFLFLAAYIAYDSILDLWSKRSPEQSISGIVLACVSLVVMPLLSRAKRRVGRAMGSAAMHADAKQTEFCTYLSAILLVGLMLNAFLGRWWSDPLAALIMVPIITKEGIDGVRGRDASILSPRNPTNFAPQIVRVRPLQKIFEPGILALTLFGLALWCFLAFYSNRHVQGPLWYSARS